MSDQTRILHDSVYEIVKGIGVQVTCSKCKRVLKGFYEPASQWWGDCTAVDQDETETPSHP